MTLEESLKQMGEFTVLDIYEPINEASLKKGDHPTDNRTRISAKQWSVEQPSPVRAYGPGTAGTFGGYVRSGLANLGVGYGAQVTDFGEAVTATVTYSNAQTGKSASQSFVIVYHGKETYGVKNQFIYSVYSSAARYRRCNDYNQCISYIRSKISALPGMTSGSI